MALVRNVESYGNKLYRSVCEKKALKHDFSFQTCENESVTRDLGKNAIPRYVTEVRCAAIQPEMLQLVRIFF